MNQNDYNQQFSIHAKCPKLRERKWRQNYTNKLPSHVGLHWIVDKFENNILDHYHKENNDPIMVQETLVQ